VFCRADGTALIRDSASIGGDPVTARFESGEVSTESQTFEFSAPKALFKTRMLLQFATFHEFDVTPDGQRFLVGTRIGEPTAQSPTVILNWTALLKK